MRPTKVVTPWSVLLAFDVHLQIHSTERQCLRSPDVSTIKVFVSCLRVTALCIASEDWGEKDQAILDNFSRSAEW